MDHNGVRGRYGRSVAVASGWYVTVGAAVAVGLASVPSPPPTDCSAWFSCLSPGESLALVMLVWGGPVLAGLLVVTALVAALVVRLVPSAVLAGTLSALITVTICAAVYAGRS
ncbi:hypothetical protein ACGFIP_23370 [Micromonospora zamorensis]|uniref:Uncharacterized protein n=1 Tax=Micromonospora jinlongensis TaxID=1287877 RepID=A0A7Z0BF85_9ACTN|nr:hypothetical protein [Micromonospora jinlongensis]NYH43167.1 hypothetical protein [Micromonospora jinlongensis]